MPLTTLHFLALVSSAVIGVLTLKLIALEKPRNKLWFLLINPLVASLVSWALIFSLVKESHIRLACLFLSALITTALTFRFTVLKRP